MSRRSPDRRVDSRPPALEHLGRTFVMVPRRGSNRPPYAFTLNVAA